MDGLQVAAGRAAEQMIEVRYTPTAADFRAAFAALARRTAQGRRGRAQRYLIGACAAAGAVLTSVADHGIRPPGLVMLLVLLLVAGLPRLQTWQAARLAAGKGELRVVVGADGVTVDNNATSTVHIWPELPHYLETPGLFLLLGGDANTHVLVLLPKRGTEDPSRLGALIARHASAC
ncbi:hypothetical protein [Kitasatospora sp. NPDC097643]|uniref:hypothetical protein n=1 Tax=Kitasatospora sp. NPDC097643 TaxID=3157230 RepID=UPI00332D12CA